MYKLTFFFFLLASATSAQSASQPGNQAPAGVRRLPTAGPLQFAHLDLDTGVLTSGGQALSLVNPCYDNSFDADLPDALLFFQGDELFDWGVKSCSGSGFVDRITIGYASQASLIGGASLDVQLYRGSLGYGEPGELLLSLELRGIPAFDLPGSLGNNPIHLIIDLGAESFFLPDGPIGWGYRNVDGLTAPLLVDSGFNGTENAFDVYRGGPASAASYEGTYTLPPGGASNDPTENSFFIQLYQNDTPATQIPIPVGANPNILSATAPPVVGSSWYLQVDTQTFADPQATLVLLAGFRSINTQTPWGTLALNLGTQILPVSIRPGTLHQYDMPPNADLVGQRFFAQAGVIDAVAGFQLTNALDLTIGTF